MSKVIRVSDLAGKVKSIPANEPNKDDKRTMPKKATTVKKAPPKKEGE